MITGVPSFSSIHDSNTAPDQRRRHGRQQEQPRQPPLRGGRPLAVDDEPEPLTHVHREVLAEVEDRGEERAEVEGDVERLLDLGRVEVVPPEQPRDEQQVPARRDRQELREPLDETEHDGVEDRHRRRRSVDGRDEPVDGMIRADHGRASSQW